MYADIIVDISHEQLDKTFQYAIPPALQETVKPGVMVNIPFGKGNRLITGYVIELSDTPKCEICRIKEIDSVAKNRVQAVERMIQLAAWLKRNYGSTMNQALKTVLPVKEKVRHKEKKTAKLIITKEEAKGFKAAFEKKHATAKLRLLNALCTEDSIDCDVIRNKLNITMQTVNALKADGILEIEREELYRNPIKKIEKEDARPVLNEQQKFIVDSIINDYDSGVRNTYLIHGITGSGKTLCYIELIEHVVAMGKQVIMLIPEIALTFQTVQRFYNRFGNSVSILNSRMSKGERFDQLLKAMRGEISIMIGPRSALFTPFMNLGLIVIDEEHEGAYKSEQAPRYHARETAVHIANTCNASVILGSATPSLESFYRAKKGEYKLFTLTERASGGTLPVVYTEDLREELKCGNRSIFSRRLQKLILNRLQKKEQIMLFLNKRGYAGFVSCRMCGYVVKCPHCDISMTAHKNGKLICHYCGYEQPVLKACPKCGSKYITGFRAGTQQVEEMIKKMYPYARVLRMDMDTTTGKEGHEMILSAFANHEADILIGTQMIVKGHDFPDVTLVGILAADMSLYANDFRATERTFQLLTQAAGRAGRGNSPGEVVIQTYTPDNYSIRTAAQQDYESFYEEELAYRSLMDYPPVNNMLMVNISSKNEEQLLAACEVLKEEIFCDYNAHMKEMTVTGPVQAAVYKLNDYYNQVVYAKSSDYDKLIILKDRLEKLCIDNPVFRNIGLQFDFN